MSGKTNTREDLLTSRNRKGAQDADRLWPKWRSERFPLSLLGNADITLTGIQDPSTPFVIICTELGKPVAVHKEVEALPRGGVARRRVEDAGQSEGGSVIEPIGIAPSGNIIPPERGPTSGRSESTNVLPSLSRRCMR